MHLTVSRPKYFAFRPADYKISWMSLAAAALIPAVCPHSAFDRHKVGFGPQSSQMSQTRGVQ